MLAYLWRTISALLLTTLVSCSGLDHGGIPEPDKPTPPQPEQIVITLQPNPISFSDEGGSQLVSIQVQGGTGVWRATTNPEDDWIAIQVVKPSATDGQLKVTAQPNKIATSRETIVTIKSGEQTEQINISQNAAGSLLITKNRYEVPQTGATIDVEIKHDVEFQTQIPEKFTTWISPATTKQLAVTTHSFVIKPNTDKVSREGYVEIVSKLGTECVTILQAHATTTDPEPSPDPPQTDKIEVTPATVSLLHAGGQAKIAVVASASYTTAVTQGSQWLRVVSTTTDELTVEATPNPTQQKRQAEVKLNCGEASATVTLTQETAPTPVYEAEFAISTPGTLEIPDDQIVTLTSLKLAGPLNAKDFGLLGQIVNLKNLDLSSVTTTTLPTEAYTVVQKVETVVLPALLEVIPTGALTGSKNLRKVSIGVGLQMVEDNAFSGCNVLEGVTFAVGSKLRGVGVSAFMGCRKLASVALPQGVESVGVSAFAGCSALRSVVLPQSLRELGMSAFMSCVALEGVAIPEGVVEVGATTFANCFALRSLRLPASLLRLGSGAFGGCKGLVEVICGAVEPPELEGGRGVFMNVGSGCALRVPKGSGAKYQAAEGWKEVFGARVVEGL